MTWASRPATGTSGRPRAGRHRRRGPIGLGVLGVAVLLVLTVAAAMFSPTLLGWPPPSRGAAAQPSTVGSATPTPTPSTAPATAPTRTPGATRRPPRRTTPPVETIGAFETEVLALTNARRRDEGCPELRLDTRLRTAARRHSVDMARFGYMNHTGRDGSSPARRLRDAGYNPDFGWAENIARGYANPSAVMTGWMNSPGHRANILNCSLRSLGVGVARSNGGQVFWTQDFGAR